MRSAILPIQASDHSYYYLPTFGIISCPSAFGHKAAFFPKRPAGRPSIALLPLVEPVQHVSDFLPRALMTFLAISRPLIVAVREFSPGALCAGSSRRRSKADTNYAPGKRPASSSFTRSKSSFAKGLLALSAQGSNI